MGDRDRDRHGRNRYSREHHYYHHESNREDDGRHHERRETAEDRESRENYERDQDRERRDHGHERDREHERDRRGSFDDEHGHHSSRDRRGSFDDEHGHHSSGWDRERRGSFDDEHGHHSRERDHHDHRGSFDDEHGHHSSGRDRERRGSFDDEHGHHSSRDRRGSFDDEHGHHHSSGRDRPKTGVDDKKPRTVFAEKNEGSYILAPSVVGKGPSEKNANVAQVPLPLRHAQDVTANKNQATVNVHVPIPPHPTKLDKNPQLVPVEPIEKDFPGHNHERWYFFYPGAPGTELPPFAAPMPPPPVETLKHAQEAWPGKPQQSPCGAPPQPQPPEPPPAKLCCTPKPEPPPPPPPPAPSDHCTKPPPIPTPVPSEPQQCPSTKAIPPPTKSEPLQCPSKAITVKSEPLQCPSKAISVRSEPLQCPSKAIPLPPSTKSEPLQCPSKPIPPPIEAGTCMSQIVKVKSELSNANIQTCPSLAKPPPPPPKSTTSQKCGPDPNIMEVDNETIQTSTKFSCGVKQSQSRKVEDIYRRDGPTDKSKSQKYGDDKSNQDLESAYRKDLLKRQGESYKSRSDLTSVTTVTALDAEQLRQPKQPIVWYQQSEAPYTKNGQDQGQGRYHFQKREEIEIEEEEDEVNSNPPEAEHHHRRRKPRELPCDICGIGVYKKKVTTAGYIASVLLFPCGTYACLKKKWCVIYCCTYCGHVKPD